MWSGRKANLLTYNSSNRYELFELHQWIYKWSLRSFRPSFRWDYPIKRTRHSKLLSQASFDVFSIFVSASTNNQSGASSLGRCNLRCRVIIPPAPSYSILQTDCWIIVFQPITNPLLLICFKPSLHSCTKKCFQFLIYSYSPNSCSHIQLRVLTRIICISLSFAFFTLNWIL
jgi:hypothetical protein